jgi:UDP-glucose 4-epimerase
MKVLLTGAFGNVGSNTLENLIEQGHDVRTFDLNTKAGRKTAGRFKGKIETLWGDLRRPDDVATAVKDRDVVIHIGFVIPPTSEQNPELAREVNVNGTRNLIDAMKNVSSSPKIIFSSTASVFGATHHMEPPRTCSDPLEPTDHYTSHKVDCEKMITESGLEWSILRLVAVPRAGQIDPVMFDIPLVNRIEFVHPRDVGLAIANAVSCDGIWGKIMLIGGGEGRQLLYRDYITGLMEGAGVGMLPDEAFGNTPFYTDWMDTTESQRLLKYQRYFFDDYVNELPRELGYQYRMIKAFRPVIRRWLLSKSVHYKKAQAKT